MQCARDGCIDLWCGVMAVDVLDAKPAFEYLQQK
jgi:hypothetical protein